MHARAEAGSTFALSALDAYSFLDAFDKIIGEMLFTLYFMSASQRCRLRAHCWLLFFAMSFPRLASAPFA